MVSYGAIRDMQEEQVQFQQEDPIANDVSFPTNGGGGKKRILPKWIFAILGVLLILGGGIWFILQTPSDTAIEPNPTPVVDSLSTFATPEATPDPGPTATPEPVDKSEIAIEILNGTGVPGEAGFLEDKLEAAGFKDLTAGNAESQSETETTVTFDREVASSVVEEISDLLKGIYTKVVAKKASLGSVQVRVVTGPRTGVSSATASPSATATPSSSPSPSPTAE